MLERIRPITALVEEMLDQLPKAVFTSTTTTFLDPCMGGGQFVAAIERRLRKHGHNDANIAKRVYGVENNEFLHDYAVNTHDLVGSYYVEKNYLEYEETMKFDVVIGNPPYQDGAQAGQQNKIYNQFSKKALTLINEDDGILCFITPSSVCKATKRFSIVSQDGLKYVDFSANNHFDVGVNICWWMVDNSYTGTVSVIANNKKTKKFAIGDVIYDHEEFDSTIMSIREAIRAASISPTNRMFLRNNPGPTKSKTKTGAFIYPLNNFDGSSVTCYVKKAPFYHNKKKLVLPMTKAFNENNIVVDTNDYDDGTVCIAINNKQEIDNIKSFLFCDYFVDLVKQWKAIDGYGFNEAIKYLPPFDKTTRWTNTQVKKFINGFI